jgi:hypothetical protein
LIAGTRHAKGVDAKNAIDTNYTKLSEAKGGDGSKRAAETVPGDKQFVCSGRTACT